MTRKVKQFNSTKDVIEFVGKCFEETATTLLIVNDNANVETLQNLIDEDYYDKVVVNNETLHVYDFFAYSEREAKAAALHYLTCPNDACLVTMGENGQTYTFGNVDYINIYEGEDAIGFYVGDTYICGKQANIKQVAMH